jgi:transposase
MAFVSVSSMESRRKLVHDVTVSKFSLSEACRHAGVTRKTGRKWVVRARECGLENLSELSRAPRAVVRKTEPSKEAALLELRSQYPEWGARKLSGVLGRDYGIELASRTADHILKRHGLTAAPPKRSEPCALRARSAAPSCRWTSRGCQGALLTRS